MTERREFIRFAESLGYTVTKSAGGHLRCTHPRVPHPIFAAYTPTCYRSYRNSRADLRRALRRG